MTSKEIWKAISGYEGLYSISDHGRVRSLPRWGSPTDRILSRKPNSRGYLNVTLYDNGVRGSFQIHVLVAIAFKGFVPCGKELVVDHIDYNKTNNHVSNLQIITHRENTSKDRWRNSKTSQYAGVSRYRDKWQSQVQINGKNVHLGSFINEHDAHIAYQTKLAEL